MFLEAHLTMHLGQIEIQLKAGSCRVAWQFLFGIKNCLGLKIWQNEWKGDRHIGLIRIDGLVLWVQKIKSLPYDVYRIQLSQIPIYEPPLWKKLVVRSSSSFAGLLLHIYIYTGIYNHIYIYILIIYVDKPSRMYTCQASTQAQACYARKNSLQVGPERLNKNPCSSTVPGTLCKPTRYRSFPLEDNQCDTCLDTSWGGKD